MAGNPPRPRDPKRPPPDNGDGCGLEIDLDLEGIDPAVLATVRKGQLLSIAIQTLDTYTSVVCETSSGGVLGSLSAFEGIAMLIRCLDQGRRYEVSITEIGPGHCHVRGGLIQP